MFIKRHENKSIYWNFFKTAQKPEMCESRITNGTVANYKVLTIIIIYERISTHFIVFVHSYHLPSKSPSWRFYLSTVSSIYFLYDFLGFFLFFRREYSSNSTCSSNMTVMISNTVCLGILFIKSISIACSFRFYMPKSNCISCCLFFF